MNHAQIAMNRPGGIQHIGPGTGGIEGASHFLADISRFSHTGDAYPSAFCKALGVSQQVQSLGETVIQPVGGGE